MIETLDDLKTYLATTNSNVTFLKIYLTNSTSYSYLPALINSLNTQNTTYDFIETNSLEIITFYTHLINDFPCILSFQKVRYNPITYWEPCRKISLNATVTDIATFLTLSLYYK
jgi:hypothetical protein